MILKMLQSKWGIFMKILASKFAFFMLIFISFTTWLALNQYVRFNIFLLLLAAMSYQLCKRKFSLFVQKNTSVERFCLNAYLCVATISFLCALCFYPNPKLISNFTMHVFIIIVFYYSLSEVIQKTCSLNTCIKGLAYGGVFLMFVITIDSILVNFFDIRIHDWFIFGYEGNASYFNRFHLWFSTSAPAEESGSVAGFLNLLIPFVILYFKKSKILFSMLYIFCLFSLFSTAGYLIFSIGMLAVFILSIKTPKNLFRGIIISILFITCLLWNYEKLSPYFEQVKFWEKVTLSGETSSDSIRSNAVATAIGDGLNAPLIGNGSGYGVSTVEGGYSNTFLIIFAEYGIIAFLLFSLFFLSIWIKCLQLPKNLKPFFVYSLICISLKAMTGAQIHNLAFWILVPIITKAYNESRREKCPTI